MSQKEQDKNEIPHLEYGSIISLQLSEQDGNYIISDGHINPRVILNNFNIKQGSDADIAGQMDVFQKNPGFSQALFQVYPKVSDTLKMQIPNKIKQAYEDNQKNQQAQNGPKNVLRKENKVNSMSQEQVRTLQHRLLNEYKHNLDVFDKLKGLYVAYEQEIQLLHLDSQKFLACVDQESKYEKENFQVTLQEYSSDATRFKIIPAFKYQSDGDMLIYHNEIVEIIRAQAFHSKHPFLHASEEFSQTDERLQSLAQNFNYNSKGGMGQKKKTNLKKKEVNASLEQPSTWKIKLYQHYQSPDCNNLSTNNVVWLHHSEANSMLAAIRKDKGTNKYDFSSLNLDYWLNKNNLHISVQETSSESNYDYYQGNTFGMWIIIGKNNHQGGFVGFDKQYKLKHLPTGFYLAVAKKQDQKGKNKQTEDDLELVLTDRFEDEKNLFQFYPLKTSQSIHDKEIKNGSFVFLRNSYSKKWVDIASILNQDFTHYKKVPKQALLKQELSENQVFKLYKAPQQDVWEIKFLNSCFYLLIKFTNHILNKSVDPQNQDNQTLKYLKKKVMRVHNCVNELDNFVSNKYGNHNMDMDYGSLNVHKQSLMREQYLIDILVKILEEILKKPELDFYQNYQLKQKEEERQKVLRAIQAKQEQNNSFQKSVSSENKGDMLENSQSLSESQQIQNDQESLNDSVLEHEKQQKVQQAMKDQDSKQYMLFLNAKLDLVKDIYSLLTSSIQNNDRNKNYLYELVPFFQIHAKYIPEAIKCITTIVKDNSQILTRLQSDISINFHHKKNMKSQQEQTRIVKFLINLYDEEVGEEDNTIQFRQHEKISAKPINLIHYFMNLIWDPTAILHSDYLRFLRYTCKIGSKSVTLNQENIYKLYKKYTLIRPRIKFDEHFSSGDLKMPRGDQSEEQFQIEVGEQLLFVSDLAYGRNYLWKKELSPHFGRHYLLKNIWNEGKLLNFAELRACFIRIGMSLYIDHDPLQKKAVPNYCRLFNEVDNAEEIKIFKSNHNKDDEVDMYKDLLEQMMGFFFRIDQQIQKEIFEFSESLDNEVDAKNLYEQKGKDILNQQILLNSVELMELVLQMNLFEALDLTKYYPFITKFILKMFQYDKKNMIFVVINSNSENKFITDRIKEKIERENVLPGVGLSTLTSLVKSTKKEIEPEVEVYQDQQQDEDNLFKHQIMRGFVSLSNQLESVIYQDPAQEEIELKLKLKICDVLDYFLDLRQDYLIQNFLSWFKHSLIESKEKKTFSQFIKEHLAGLFPNISKSGFNDIDSSYKPKEENSKKFSMKLDIKIIGGEKPVPGFQNYLEKISPNFKQSFDLDSLLSVAYENVPEEDPDDPDNISFEINKNAKGQDPIASPLPTLLSTFLLIKNKRLETKCLELMMRIFNQRQEFVGNLQKVQILFDKDKSDIYQYLKEYLYQLKKHIEQQEVWFSNFINGKEKNEENDDSVYDVINILTDMIKQSFNVQFNELNPTFNIEIYQQAIDQIDVHKQSINKYLVAYEPVLELIKDGMHHFDQCVLNPNISVEKKGVLIELFRLSYLYLQVFVTNNEENQNILYEHMHIFTGFLKYDLGQVQLITQIYKNNPYLLRNSVDQEFIDLFIELLQNEGRQDHILDLFLALIKDKRKYIFDNQLLILNSFLPLKSLEEKNLKLLYIDGSNEQDLRFYLDDVTSLDSMNLMQKLQAVEFRDTYCDQPFVYHRKLLQLLLETSYTIELTEQEKEDIILLEEDGENKEQLNISVAKLKKTFKLPYLLDLLCEEDFFQLGQNMGVSNFKQNGKLNRMKSKSGNSTLNKTATGNEYDMKGQDEPVLQQDIELKNQIKQGFSLVKPVLVEYIKYVFLKSGGKSSNNDIYTYNRDISVWIDIEAKNLDKCMREMFHEKYPVYVFENLIPFFIEYSRIQQKDNANGQNLDEEDRREGEALKYFASSLVEKIQSGIFQFKDKLDEYPYELLQKWCKRAQVFLALCHDSDDNKGGQQKMLQQQFGLDDMNTSRGDGLSQAAQDEEGETLKESQRETLHINLNAVNSNTNNNNNNPPLAMGFTSNEEQTVEQKFMSNPNTVRDMMEIEDIWNDFIGQFIESTSVQDAIDQEQNALAESIISVKKLIDLKRYQQKPIYPKLELNLLLKKFIQWMQNAVDDPENKKTIGTLLNTFKKILGTAQDEKKENLQNMFDHLGGMRMILSILSDQNSKLDSQLLINLLEFANMMLEGGNNQVQKTIFEYVSNSQTSEYLFSKFNSIIRRQIEFIEEKAKQKKNANNKFKETDPKEELNHEMDIEILNNVLNFLQNCVEGHYLELQNYFREQTNSRNNYNMINAVADLLRVYYYDARVQKMYDNMIKCLDTLSEFVQGPCLENQIAVSESKFFDICSDFFTKKQKSEDQSLDAKKTNTFGTQGTNIQNEGQQEEQKQNISKGDQPLENWMIARLQNKCLVLVLSLLEMRDVKVDRSIMERIIRNIHPQDIERNISKIYKKFVKIYGKKAYPLESLDHLEEDPRKMNEKTLKKMHSLYFETIIQNGFYLFFLISYYIESDEGTLQGCQSLQLYKQLQREKVKQEVSTIESLLLGDTIIGQILSFLKSIFEVIIESSKIIGVDKINFGGGEETEEQKQQKAIEKAERQKKDVKKAFQFFSKYSAKIELVRNSKLEIVFFLLLPYAEALPKDKKIEFHDTVDRSNNKQKVQDLIDESDKLIQICKHELWLKTSKNKLLTFFGHHVKLWKTLSFTLTLLLNLFIFFSFADTKDESVDRIQDYIFFQDQEQYSRSWTQKLFQLLGVLMTVFSNFVLVFYVLKNVPLIIANAWKDSDPQKKSKDIGAFKKFYNVVFKLFKVIYALFGAVDVIYYIAYGAMALMGVLIHPFFFTFHLTEIMFRYPSLKNVLKSIYQPRRQLILTFVLFIVIEYFFTIIAYIELHEDYKGNCESILYCFVVTMDQTFKSNSGIGAFLTDINEQGNVAKEHLGRFFFDNIFFYILVLIMVEIVSGIIIDKFGELREEENEKNQDIQDKCFICGNLRTTFDRQSDTGAGFSYHIKINHYMWNYLFFIAYLEWKDPNDYTGIESFVSDRMSENDSSWFPFNKARELQDDEDITETQKDTKTVSGIRKELDVLNGNIKDIEKLITKAQHKKKQ